ncbi:MAG: Methyltransferase type 11 [Microgenomates group bacterium GW2011_GWA1_48_10]|uniref:Methyltransferase type 11 domain-containing protein n=1 Tax=Candidatus Gottesmanbacteria bacterium RIFCSPHIGHO2_01_FULL_47_48 TaxID=1798381 RepID=A0A1F5ZZA4_9BACT|nr:MAG: Methyltransferase type 11 [Microgenomates group bacterium GW2011_GWA1_48_10]OGG17806.1 MAG: hypothetical protein A2721_02175 [Candidatus Gottesmanbacteria bacterium RIFCSPHIGHO2_01_FULL_47_48]
MTSPKDLLTQVQNEIKSENELEYFLTHQNRYRFILEQIAKLNLPPAAKILDIGCFPLHLFKALELAGYEVFGVSSKHEPVKNARVVSLNIEKDKMPFANDFFDLGLFSEVMEHLLYSPLVYLEKLRKVLKPDGYLLLTTPNAIHLKHRLELLVGKSPHFPLFQLYESTADNDYIYHRHNREYTLPEIREIVRKAGFDIQSATSFNAYSPFREKLHPEGRAAKIIKGMVFLSTVAVGSFRDSIYILAQKNG